MRVVLVGLGSIGRRHLKNLRALQPDVEIIVVRHSHRDEGIPDGADHVVYRLDEALAQAPDLALVCSPTFKHVEAGIACLQAGAHVFIEKPLAADAAGARALVEAAASAGRVLIVGYNLRFLPSLRCLRDALHAGTIGRPMSVRAEVGQYLPEWRPDRDYRETNSARSELGGGVELELSHEIDYVCWLLGDVSSVDAILGRTSDLEIDVDDTAEILLRFESGAIASVHMDMAQRSATRTCRIAGVGGTLTWDALSGVVRRYTPDIGWTTLHDGDGERNEMYVSEMAHAVACARGEARPLIDGTDGFHVVEIAAAARLSSQSGQRINV